MKRADLIWQAVVIGSGIVALLSLLWHFFISELLFYLLFPGLVIGILITGGHGGTVGEERIASVVSFAVNALVYSALVFSALAIKRRN